jgi:hypothetical protein
MTSLRLIDSGLNVQQLESLLAPLEIQRIEKGQLRPSVPARGLDPQILVAIISGGFAVLGAVLGPLITEIYKARRERLSKALKPLSPMVTTVRILDGETITEIGTVEVSSLQTVERQLAPVMKGLREHELSEHTELEIVIEDHY